MRIGLILMIHQLLCLQELEKRMDNKDEYSLISHYYEELKTLELDTYNILIDIEETLKEFKENDNNNNNNNAEIISKKWPKFG